LRGRCNDRPSRSPAEAGVQEREALPIERPDSAPLLRSGLGPGLRRGTTMKPISVWPMLIMLVVIVFLIAWLWGYA
jgi:hypothetical protein